MQRKGSCLPVKTRWPTSYRARGLNLGLVSDHTDIKRESYIRRSPPHQNVRGCAKPSTSQISTTANRRTSEVCFLRNKSTDHGRYNSRHEIFFKRVILALNTRFKLQGKEKGLLSPCEDKMVYLYRARGSNLGLVSDHTDVKRVSYITKVSSETNPPTMVVTIPGTRFFLKG